MKHELHKGDWRCRCDPNLMAPFDFTIQWWWAEECMLCGCRREEAVERYEERENEK